MGDPKRFELFASFIARVVRNRRARIADVAAGKGALSFALLRHGFSNVTPFEPDPRRGGHVTRLGMRVETFRSDFAQDFDVIVGMHPDAATDHILDSATRYRRVAIVCPCCALPSAWEYRGTRAFDRHGFDQWVEHLTTTTTEHGLDVWRTRLPMTGRSDVLMAGATQEAA